MGFTIQAHAECSCGEIVSWDDDTTTDETVLFCKKCGDNLGTYGDVRRKLALDAGAALEDILRRSQKR